MTQSTPVQDSDQDEAFDREQYNEMRLISGDDFAVLLDQFHSNALQGLLSIRAAIETGDGAELKRASHKLKGTAATLGAKGLAALCLELEVRGKEQRFEGAIAALDRLESEYLKTRALFEALEQESRLADAS
jgi:histidine phosphotransfer protein HptB